MKFMVEIALALDCLYALLSQDLLLSLLVNGACALYFAYQAHKTAQKELYGH